MTTTRFPTSSNGRATPRLLRNFQIHQLFESVFIMQYVSPHRHVPNSLRHVSRTQAANKKSDALPAKIHVQSVCEVCVYSKAD